MDVTIYIHPLFLFLLHAVKQVLVRDSGFLRSDVASFLVHMTLEKQLTSLRNVSSHSSNKAALRPKIPEPSVTSLLIVSRLAASQ